jgi:uncharacterized protein YbbC (DUF1343 family)
MKKVFYIQLVLLLSLFSITDAAGQKVRTGADILVSEKSDLLKGKNVGLVVNHSALLSDGRHIADVLNEMEGVKITALFGPEHGIRGDTTGKIEDMTDPATGVKVYSLYGKTYKPTKEMMKDVDMLIYDIQDVGARFYTYITTLGHIMEAAAEKNIPVLVLDRPNPIAGNYIDGPIADENMKSFVAYAPIPIAHGMTVGELATMYNEENWLQNGMKSDLTVIKMEGWNRNTWYDETELKWVKPSPNMPFLSTAVVYPGTCLFEGVNVSEGRGSEKPFEYIAAPWIDHKKIAGELNSAGLKGVEFKTIEFTPEWFSFNSRQPKYYQEKVNGIFVDVTDREAFESVKAGIYLLWAIHKNHKDKFEWRKDTIDRLAGTTDLRTMIDSGMEPDEIFLTWNEGLDKFKTIRSKHLLY